MVDELAAATDQPPAPEARFPARAKSATLATTAVSWRPADSAERITTQDKTYNRCSFPAPSSSTSNNFYL